MLKRPVFISRSVVSPVGISMRRRPAIILLPVFAAIALAIQGPVLAGEKTIRLQLKWYHQFQFAGYYAAQAKGFYKAEGLSVEIIEGGDEYPPLERVLEGHADFGVSDSDVVLARMNGKPLVACAAIFQHSPYVFMSLWDRGIRSPSDLIGTRVMLADDQGAAQFRAMLIREGIDPAEVNIIRHSWNTDDLVNGRVDAMSAYAMVEPVRLKSQGVETHLLRALDYGVDFYGDTLFTTEAFLDEHPELVDAFVRASLKGWHYAIQNPEEIADLILAMDGVRERGDTRDIILQHAKNMSDFILSGVVELGHMNQGRWEHIAKIFSELNMAPADYSLDGFMYDPDSSSNPHLARRILIGALVCLLATGVGLLWMILIRHQVNVRTKEIRASEAAHRLNAEKQSAILDALPAEVALLDENGVIVEVNKTWRRFCGENSVNPDAEHTIGQNYLELCDKVVGEEAVVASGVAAGIRSVLSGAMPSYEVEYPCHSPDEQRWFRFIVSPVGSGSPSGAVVTHIDITDRKLAEMKTHRLSRLYAVSSAVNEAIIRVRDTKDLYQVACRIVVEEGGMLMAWVGMAGKNNQEIQPVAVFGKEDGYLSRIRISVEPDPNGIGPTGSAFREGLVFFSNDIAHDPKMSIWRNEALERGYCSSAAFPLRSGEKVVGVFSVYAGHPDYFSPEEIRLLTALSDNISFAIESHAQEARRLQMEESLRESEERFRQLAENINEVFWISLPDKQTMLYVSPAYEVVWGRTRESLYRSPAEWMEAVHPEDRQRIEASAHTRQLSGEYNEVYRIKRPDGSIRWIHDRAFPVRDGGGEVYRIVGTAEDITEQKQMEKQFLRSQRLESIGTLAGGIAHDLNNVLTPITMSVMMLKDIIRDQEALDLLATLEKSAERGASLIKQVLSFARGVEGRRVTINLLHPLREIERIIHDTFPKNIVFEITSCRDPWAVICDPTQMHQVFMNLFVNARDAMPAGGRIAVSLRNIEITANYAAINPDAREGRYVMVTVADNGEGMTQEVLDKIFEPFFTTKEVGQGTGLGLSTSLAIIKSHGGFVTVTSEPGRGSTFKVYLKAEAPAGTYENTSGDESRKRRGDGQLVLVVDDEEGVRKVAKRTLERFGYRVLLAAHGADAVAIYARQQGEIDVVITDMAMPIMDGPALIAALKAINPKVKIIAASGYASNTSMSGILKAGVTHFVPKPYSAETLLATIHELLGPETSQPRDSGEET